MEGGGWQLQAFSLIEILMTVAMLSIIILGLVAMFDQTRRAFTSSMQQVDYLEGGRSTMTMIANDLEEMAPTYVPISLSTSTVNNPNFENFYMDVQSTNALIQPLADPTESRTNIIQEFFFVSRYNQYWNVIGYRLDWGAVSTGIGSLYRFSSNNIPVNSTNLTSFIQLFTTNNADVSQIPNFSHIIDGVVHLRVRAFDPSGAVLPSASNPIVYLGRNNNISINAATVTNEAAGYRFRSNAVPAYVEVELGVLENRTLQRYYSMTNNMQVAQQYLDNHAGQVHIFRQRVPIRAVDLSAYNGLLAYTNVTTVLP